MKAFHPMKCNWDSNKGLGFLEYYSKHKVYHPGYDYNFGNGNDDHGAEVVSMVDGRVEYVAPIGKTNGGLGNFMIIEYPAYGVWCRYAHLDQILVSQNSKVKAGQQVATCGRTGTSWSHLHAEVFGMNAYDILKRHWRRFAYYPSGKSKEWVAGNFMDPVKFVNNINKDEHWSSEAMNWLLTHEIIKNEHSPEDVVTWGEYTVTMKRLAEKVVEWNKL